MAEFTGSPLSTVWKHQQPTSSLYNITSADLITVPAASAGTFASTGSNSWVSIVLFTLCGLGLLFNGFVLVVLFYAKLSQRRLNCSVNVFIINQSLADFMGCLSIIIFIHVRRYTHGSRKTRERLDRECLKRLYSQEYDSASPPLNLHGTDPIEGTLFKSTRLLERRDKAYVSVASSLSQQVELSLSIVINAVTSTLIGEYKKLPGANVICIILQASVLISITGGASVANLVVLTVERYFKIHYASQSQLKPLM